MPRLVKLDPEPNFGVGDLLMMNYPEMLTAARVDRLYTSPSANGFRWQADVTWPGASMRWGHEVIYQSDLDSMLIVTHEELGEAHEDRFEHGHHQGGIRQVVALRRHGKLRVWCR